MTRKILILAPHPDDEVVGACAMMGRAQKKGAEIFVRALTHGCVAQETLWPWDRNKHAAMRNRRRAEFEKSAQFLGFTITHISDRPARKAWRELDAVADEIRQDIKDFEITELWVPAYEGGNADHDAINACAALVGKETHLPVFEFAEYNFKDQKTAAQTFPESLGTETLILLREDEKVIKSKALSLYQSEQKNLFYVGLTQECLRPLALYDYTRPAHDGVLWYTRFHWVPFRHPRVDFSTPTQVSQAIQAFLQKH